MQRILPILVIAVGVIPARGAEPAKQADAWVEPMTKVHARFSGTPGTFAQFGDSITVTMAYWSPLAYESKGLSPEASKTYDQVKKYLKSDCWAKWKGPEYGSDGGMTIRWAQENVDRWLRALNPEVVLILFGTNDVTQLEVKEYEEKYREVVEHCLKNGSVVIVSTIPPRSGQVEKCKQFNDVVRKIGKDKQVPVIDYFEEVVRRRPDDWDGSAPKFKEVAGDTYEVPTLIARDGVHPSYPKKYHDYSEESLTNSGYSLRTYLTLMTYGEVVRKVAKPAEK